MNINFNYISEKDMDLLIIEEFISNQEFANIFLRKVNIEEYKIIQVNHSLMDAILGESDIQIIIESDSKKIAILIEDKIDAIAMNDQYHRYFKRGTSGIEKGFFDVFHVFITAPFKYIESNAEAKKYPNVVLYEELLDYFSNGNNKRYQFKAKMIETAIHKQSSGYLPIEDKNTTRFWRKYYDYIIMNYPMLELKRNDGPRGSKAVWAWFNTYHKDIKIIHKANRGIVDLIFGKSYQNHSKLIEELTPLLQDKMSIQKSGKSIGIRIYVSKLDFKNDFEDQVDLLSHTCDQIKEFHSLLSKNIRVIEFLRDF